MSRETLAGMAKAILGASAAALISAAGVGQDGTMTMVDWVTVAGSFVGVLSTVYYTPNKAPAAPAAKGDLP